MHNNHQAMVMRVVFDLGSPFCSTLNTGPAQVKNRFCVLVSGFTVWFVKIQNNKYFTKKRSMKCAMYYLFYYRCLL